MSAVRLAGVRQPFTPNKYRHVPEILRVRRAKRRGLVGQPGIVHTTVEGSLVRAEHNVRSVAVGTTVNPSPPAQIRTCRLPAYGSYLE
jgi:hypothetical protein